MSDHDYQPPTLAVLTERLTFVERAVRVIGDALLGSGALREVERYHDVMVQLGEDDVATLKAVAALLGDPNASRFLPGGDEYSETMARREGHN